MPSSKFKVKAGPRTSRMLEGKAEVVGVAGNTFTEWCGDRLAPSGVLDPETEPFEEVEDAFECEWWYEGDGCLYDCVEGTTSQSQVFMLRSSVASVCEDKRPGPLRKKVPPPPMPVELYAWAHATHQVKTGKRRPRLLICKSRSAYLTFEAAPAIVKAYLPCGQMRTTAGQVCTHNYPSGRRRTVGIPTASSLETAGTDIV